MRRFAFLIIGMIASPLISLAQGTPAPKRALPDFQAKSLTGQVAQKKDLTGQPSILIVNPSEEAGDKSIAWARAIREEFGPDIRQRSIIAVQLPFFKTEYLALDKARKKVEQKYWPRTWLLRNTGFEDAIGVAKGSPDPYIFVIDPEGNIVNQVQGPLDKSKMAQIAKAYDSIFEQQGARLPASSQPTQPGTNKK